MTGPSPVSRRRRSIALAIVVATLAAGGGWWASGQITSPDQAAAAAAAPPPSVVTAPVELRVIQDTLVGRGTVAPARTVDVRLRAPSGTTGDPVVTAVHVSQGQTVNAGSVLLEVSGRPVFVIQGDVPIYRDLTPGASGTDVRQLQSALSALGHAVEADGTYGPATTDAVEALYADLGFDPSPASPQDAELLHAARLQVTSAERAVEDARDAADAAAREASEPSDPSDVGAAAAAAASTANVQRSLERAMEDLRTVQDELRTVQATTGASVPASEVVTLPTFPALVRQIEATVGGAIPDVAMSLSTGDLQVTATLEAQMTGLVREGQVVDLTSEVLSQTATGTITRIDAATAATSQVDDVTGTAGSGPQFVITPDAPLPTEWNGQDVRVTIVEAASEGEVLVVPLSAVSADAQERTRVTVVDPDGAETRIQITTGVVGAGYVQVAPTAGQDDARLLTAGARVVVGVTAGASSEVSSTTPVPAISTSP